MSETSEGVPDWSGVGAYYARTLVTSLPGGYRSFTTFMLPFWYKLQRLSHGVPRDAVHYVEDDCTFDNGRRRDPTVAMRRRYFTAETSRALLDKTLSFHVAHTKHDQWWRTACIRTAGVEAERPKLVRFGVEPPEIVLFEGRDEARAPRLPNDESSSGPRDHLLRVGFLMVTVHPLAPVGGIGPAPTYGDLLVANERIRYLRGEHPYFWGTAEDPKPARRQIGEPSFWSQLLPTAPVNPGKDDLAGRELFEGWRALLDAPAIIGGTAYRLVDPSLHETTWRYLTGEWTPKGDEVSDEGWLAQPDHRAFVWTCAALEDKDPNIDRPTYEEHASFHPWRRLLNADMPPESVEGTVSAFDRAWTSSHTFERWASNGTYHGFCGHAGATLIRRFSGDVAHLPGTVALLYRDIVLLLLFDRCVAFALSDQLSRTAVSPRHDPAAGSGAGPDPDTVSGLLRIFDYFSNVYRFPLLSNQQQAIELYDLARRAMDIDALVKDIEQQVAATNDFVEGRTQTDSSREQVKLSERAGVLAVIGTLFTAASIAGGMAGGAASLFKETSKSQALALLFGLVVLCVTFIGVVWAVTAFTPLHRFVLERGEEFGQAALKSLKGKNPRTQSPSGRSGTHHG